MSEPDFEKLERFAQGKLEDAQRARIESLLERDPDSRSALERIRTGLGLEAELRAWSREDERPGRAADLPGIEGYQIERELHRGGQGVVYAAIQRATGRRVAVKVLLDGAAASPRRVYRLEREIDLAASIGHPGVVTVFDRVTTDAGQPALVMELVEGRPLDAHLRETTPALNEIVRLFAELAEAVAAAHQRGVVHRDLKPSNVLVDPSGQPRVLDFGIAKRAEAEDRASLATRDGEFVGTLAYAAPERFRGDDTNADVRGDVYALGVMLFEALTGRLPFDRSGSIAAVLERMRDADPPAPSALRTGLPRDADIIVGTALENDLTRRYQSASAFGDDLRRFLASEPIVAREASVVYQLRKLAQRRRAAAIALGVSLAALLIVTGVIAVALVRTSEANARAEANRERQARMNAFLREVLTSPEPGRAGPDLLAVDLLEGVGDRIESEFAGYPDVQISLYSTIGAAFWRLGSHDAAESLMERAVALIESGEGGADPRELPSMLSSLGSIAQTRGDLERAAELHESALGHWRRAELNGELGLPRTLGNLAAVRLAAGEHDEATRLYTEALGMLEGPTDDQRLLRAQALVSSGTVHRQQERYDEALECYAEALPILNEQRGPEHPDTLACTGNEIEVLQRLGRAEEAEARLRELLVVRRRVFGDAHESVGITLNNLGDQLREQGRYAEAVPLLEEARGVFESSLGDKHPRVGMVSYNVGFAMLRAGRPSDAEPRLREAIEILQPAVPETHWMLAQFRLSLGETLIELDRLDEAAKLVLPARDRLVSQFGPDHSRARSAEDVASRLRPGLTDE